MSPTCNIQYVHVWYQESNFEPFNKSEVLPISAVYDSNESHTKNNFIHPKDENDFNHKLKYFIRLCVCSDDWNNSCKDLSKCEDYDLVRGYIDMLSGILRMILNY